ncbi:FAD-binding oxidoreductase [Chryseolinea sp. T2]|uniref:NAD(P)/FAD-dependent oxidoreductase n=1 Tax=Chryseolinea sp. T2 TaxID=3129255 RepID=UPI003078187D
MSTRQHFDYIVIGLGLAGAAVALKLHQLGRKILVVDWPEGNTSSRIAAGIFNPVTGRKMTKTWLADQLFPSLEKHYSDAEGLTGRKFFHPKPIYRPFHSIEEQNEWMGKSSDPVYSPFIRDVKKGPSLDGVIDPLGGLLLDKCGFVDTNAYVDGVRNLLSRHQTYLGQMIEDSLLVSGESSVRYGEYEADHVIICTGVHSTSWFKWLPIRPLKGETLQIQSAVEPQWIVNRGAYLVPQMGSWRAGATYSYTDNNPGTTEESLHELTAAIKELIHLPFTVESQQWGFRPTTPDRRPLVGRHPGYHRMWTLNGLGTKGVSLAPFFSGELISAIENGTPLNKLVDIERYKSLYWTSLT